MVHRRLFEERCTARFRSPLRPEWLAPNGTFSAQLLKSLELLQPQWLQCIVESPR